MSKAHVLGWALVAELVVVAGRAQGQELLEPVAEPPEGSLDSLVVPRSRAHAELSITGFWSRHEGQRETGAMVSLTFPLERLVAPTAMRRSEPSGWIGDGAGKPAESKGGSDQAARLPMGRRITPRVARTCVRAAWRIGGVLSDDELLAMSARARYSAVLPEVGVRVSRGWDNSFRLLPTDTDPYRTQQVNGTSQWLEGRLSWRLDRALFSDEEIPIEKLRMHRLEERSRIATRVLRELFDWQKADLMERDPVLSTEEHMSAMVRRMEAEATLDVMTGGWFSEWLVSQSEAFDL